MVANKVVGTVLEYSYQKYLIYCKWGSLGVLGRYFRVKYYYRRLSGMISIMVI